MKEEEIAEARDLVGIALKGCRELLAVPPPKLHWHAAEKLRRAIVEDQENIAATTGNTLDQVREYLVEILPVDEQAGQPRDPDVPWIRDYRKVQMTQPLARALGALCKTPAPDDDLLEEIRSAYRAAWNLGPR